MTPPASGFTTRGRRSGACGHVHPDEASAQACADLHRAGHAKSDRRVYPWSRAGRKPAAGAPRSEHVQVRLSGEEVTRLDSVRGALSRADWFRACLHGASSPPDQSTP